MLVEHILKNPSKSFDFHFFAFDAFVTMESQFRLQFSLLPKGYYFSKKFVQYREDRVLPVVTLVIQETV